MRKQSIKSIKHVFIGVMATLALLAGSAPVTADDRQDHFPFPSAEPPGRSCLFTDSDGIPLYLIEAGYAATFNIDDDPNDATKLRVVITPTGTDPVTTTDLDPNIDTGPWPLPVTCRDGTLCALWWYRYTKAGSVNKGPTTSGFSILSKQNIFQGSEDMKVQNPLGSGVLGFVGEGDFTQRIARIKKLARTGFIITNKSFAAPVRGLIIDKGFKGNCLFSGPGDTFEPPVGTFASGDQCVSLPGGFLTMEVPRGRDGCETKPGEIVVYFNNPTCAASGNPGFAPVRPNRGNIACKARGPCNECISANSNSPTVVQYITSDGDAIEICFDLENANPSSPPCDPLQIKKDLSGCTFFCTAGGCSGNLLTPGTPGYACTP